MKIFQSDFQPLFYLALTIETASFVGSAKNQGISIQIFFGRLSVNLDSYCYLPDTYSGLVHFLDLLN